MGGMGSGPRRSGLESKHAGFKHADHIYRETEKPATEDKLCWLLLQEYLFNLYK